ncbi:MAG: c-type cytochrome domain-containing protein [Verrucomicrobiota bacterium]
MRPRLLLALAPNFVLALLALWLKPDGAERGPALLSIIGNFHILALHVPAALLLIVPLFEVWERHEGAAGITVRRLSLISAVGTFGASFCGVMHAHFNGFAGDGVESHLWAGVAASFFAAGAWVVLEQPRRMRLIAQGAAIAVMSLAAHVGGELVHDEGFPFRPNKAVREQRGIAKLPSAAPDDFRDVVQPILENYCVGCHGAKKVKGKLRMDSIEAMLKGGEEGPALVHGDLKKSTIFVRITLDKDDDEAMPPSEEAQLNAAQIEAIRLWIERKPIPAAVAKEARVTAKK